MKKNAKPETDEIEAYAALWGCDPCYDRAPRLPGDGYLFYNFAVEGNDPAFLAKFLPAIGRTIQEVEQRKDDPEQAADLENLRILKDEVKERLKALVACQAACFA